MGYTTTFNGSVQIEPPFTPEEIEKLRTFSAQRHDEDGYPGIWCNWISTPEGDALIWDGTEKFYYSPDWMRFIIDHFIKAVPGRLANGVIEALGEDPNDRWTLVVANNTVTAPLRRGEHRFHELFDAFLRGRVKLAEVQS